MTDYRYTAETTPAVGATITTTAYYHDGGTAQVTGKVTRSGTIAGWFIPEGRNVERRFEHYQVNAPAPLYTYSDTHTGEFDNYADYPDPNTMVLYVYQQDPNTGAANYRDYFSTVLHRTDRTIEGDRAEDPEAWEPATDTYSPEGHDVNPGYTGDEIAVNGVVWAVDYAAEIPPLPAGWPTTRPLTPAPGRKGWTGTGTATTYLVTLPGTPGPRDVHAALTDAFGSPVDVVRQ